MLAGLGLVLYRGGRPSPILPSVKDRNAELETQRIEGDGENIADCATESFDFLFAANCPASSAEPYYALTNWLRVIRPNGHLAVQTPPPDMGALIGQIAHLAVPLDSEPGRAVRILRKRSSPITPTDSEQSEQAQLLEEFTQQALNERGRHPDIAHLNDILSSGACSGTLVDLSRLYMLCG